MYYAWNWWWSFFWTIPVLILLFGLFAWGGRRNGGYRSYRPWRDPRGYDWGDDGYLADGYPKRRRYRGLGPRDYQRSEMRIREDVNDQLLLNDEIDAREIEVQVEGSTVILRGGVANRFQKRLAEAVADAVAGVTDVENRLRIGTQAQTPAGAAPAGVSAPSSEARHA